MLDIVLNFITFRVDTRKIVFLVLRMSVFIYDRMFSLVTVNSLAVAIL